MTSFRFIRLGQLGQAQFQIAMLFGVAGERRRTARADSVHLDRFDDFTLDVGIVRHAEVAV
jgi:hypothetical protein